MCGYISEDRIVGSLEAAHRQIKAAPWLTAHDALQVVARELGIDLGSHAPDTIPAPPPAYEPEPDFDVTDLYDYPAEVTP